MKHTMRTHSGRIVNPLALRPEDISGLDIAHHLSRLARWCGATDGVYGYSVAQHSLHVSSLCPPGLELQGLLHDAAEAYLGDLIGPIKHGGGMEAYLLAEARARASINERFGILQDAHAENLLRVKAADLAAFDTEHALLFRGIGWLKPMSPEDAKSKFVAALRLLLVGTGIGVE